MATSIQLTAPTNNTDANFRIWTKAIRDSILAVGWTQTADTGQIDFVTVLAPVVANNFPGFIIMAMADALQGTHPCYLRMGFGSSTGAADRPAIQFSIGTGTNGAGTLTGNVCTLRTSFAGASQTTAISSYISGTTSRLTCCLWANNSTWQIPFNVERSVNSSGVNTNTGMGIRSTWGPGAGTATQQFVPNVGLGAVPAAEANWLCFGSNANAVSAGLNLSSISGVRQAYGPLNDPELGFMVCASQFAIAAPLTISRYSSNRQYFVCTASMAFQSVSYGVACQWMMLWE